MFGRGELVSSKKAIRGMVSRLYTSSYVSVTTFDPSPGILKIYNIYSLFIQDDILTYWSEKSVLTGGI